MLTIIVDASSPLYFYLLVSIREDVVSACNFPFNVQSIYGFQYS